MIYSTLFLMIRSHTRADLSADLYWPRAAMWRAHQPWQKTELAYFLTEPKSMPRILERVVLRVATPVHRDQLTPTVMNNQLSAFRSSVRPRSFNLLTTVRTVI